MASKTKKRIEVSRFEDLCTGLDNLMPAEPDTLSRSQMLTKLWHKIQPAMKRGCSISDLHAYLKKVDAAFDVSMETIKRDLKAIAEEEANKATKTSRKKRRTGPAPTTQPSAEAVSTSGQSQETTAANLAASGPRAQQAHDPAQADKSSASNA